MTGITYLCKRYLHEVQTSEMYMTAQRTVKTGLVASAIVSSWTWAATLLTSTEVAYKYGVSVSFFFFFVTNSLHKSVQLIDFYA